MKSPLAALPILLALAGQLPAAPRVNVAEDEASVATYNSGWNAGSNGGSGFEPWVLHQVQKEGEESHAGFFIADAASSEPIPEHIAINGKAFGIFANGRSFESACAFRPFAKPLAVADSFSLLMAGGSFDAKFEADDEREGAVGVAVRTGQNSGSSDDYNNGARFEFGRFENKVTYQIIDGESDPDSGVPVSEGGVTVTMTLVTADTYDLEVTTMDSKETKKLPTRRLGGTEGSPLDSFCVFNRDGEKNDAFFNGFQVSRPAE